MMLTWLRSIADAALGRVPGKPGRFDTATRMWLDADFSDRAEDERPQRAPKRKPAADEDQLTELKRITKDQ